MIKTIFALGVVLSIFVFNSTYAFAAICNPAPDGVHHFNAHRSNGKIIHEESTHTYLYGYDSANKPIYRSDCKVTTYFRYCEFACSYCGTTQENTWHYHWDHANHSIDH